MILASNHASNELCEGHSMHHTAFHVLATDLGAPSELPPSLATRVSSRQGTKMVVLWNRTRSRRTPTNESIESLRKPSLVLVVFAIAIAIGMMTPEVPVVPAVAGLKVRIRFVQRDEVGTEFSHTILVPLPCVRVL